MPFIDVMHTYFRGEKLEAFFFILTTGLALVVFGATALRAERGGYAWGVSVPSILFGLVLIVVGTTVGLRTDKQVADVEQSFRQNPVALVKTELPRMEKVNATFRATYYLLGMMVVVGLLVHYAGGPNLGRGLGSTLILLGAIGLLIDGFAQRRAAPYMAALVQLDVASRSTGFFAKPQALTIQPSDKRTASPD